MVIQSPGLTLTFNTTYGGRISHVASTTFSRLCKGVWPFAWLRIENQTVNRLQAHRSRGAVPVKTNQDNSNRASLFQEMIRYLLVSDLYMYHKHREVAG
jgi:hypothetical protein